MDDKRINNENRKLKKRIDALEERVSQLEISFGMGDLEYQKSPTEELSDQLNDMKHKVHLESQVGESGLAWLGNLVLFFGIAFLIQYFQKLGYSVFSIIFGYMAVSGIYGLTVFMKKSNPKMASIFMINAFLLFFLTSIKLHFFSEYPLVEGKGLVIVLAFLLILSEAFYSIKQKSKTHSAIVLLLFVSLGVISEIHDLLLLSTIFTAAYSVFLLFKFKWIKLFWFGIIVAYFGSFLFIFNNPFMGNQFQFIENHNFGYYFVLIIGAAFSAVALVKQSPKISNSSIIASIILNGFGFSFLILLYVLGFFKHDYVLLIGSISMFCILYSIFLKEKSDWKISASLFALYGYVTLSVAMYGQYDFPRVYFLLSLQSLLVVSMAIWFRSKFIVVMNTLLYLSLLLFYLTTSEMLDGVNISFTLVAILTARILNWKKDRLTIKTEYLRNIYLVVAFVMVMLSLYYMIPAQFITLSWAIAAVVYFGTSLLLKNVKYRYLALGTLLSAIVYLFLIDLARIELVFRILALMFVAAISIGTSIYYNKRKKSEAGNIRD
jgi:hypothetical protein